MLNKWNLLCFFVLISFGLFSQSTNDSFDNQINQFKKEDNLEAYFYHYIDFFVQNKDSLSPDFLDQAIQNEWRTPINNKERTAKLHLQIIQGFYYKENGEIDKSILAYENALKTYQTYKLNDYHIISYCLKPLANNYTRIGDFKRAEELLKYTISVAKASNNQKEIIASYSNLSIIYQSKGEINKAIQLLDKAIQLQPKKLQLALLLSQKAKNLILIKEYENAYKAVLQSNKKDIKKKYQVSNNATLAQYYKEKKKYDTSFKYYNANLKLLSGKRQKAKTLIAIASLYNEMYETDNSLFSLNEALQILIPNFHPKSNFDLPDRNSFYPENTIKEALDTKAIIFEKSNNIKESIVHYEASFYVEDLLRDTYLSQKAKIIQQKENRERSEKLVTLYDILFQKNNNDSLCIEMLKSIENSKAKVLLNEVNKQKHFKLVQNDTSFVKYRQLKEQIAILDNQILQESIKEQPDVHKLEVLNQNKAILTTDFTLLNQKIKQTYPFLERSSFSFEKIKSELLKNKTSIFYFFETMDFWYVFHLSEKSVNYKKIMKTKERNQNIVDFISLFSNGIPDKIDQNITRYKDLANTLFMDFFNTKTLKNQHITIIPDGILNFVPFDALLTAKSTSNNFSDLPYLVKNNIINYGYSLSILLQIKESNSEHKRKKLIGFFPVFEHNYRNNKELPYTKDEMQNISSYFKGKFYVGKEATKENFLSDSKNFDMIHVSTHASAGTENQTAKIEFYDKTLFLPEIYGLQFNSDLIVLSACETGIGKLEKGEGAMSLSRGFSYAGIPNLIVSQWKVNDKSTSLLMDEFYQNLKKTNSISTSLSQAKNAYLASNDISTYKKNPFYWSGFVFIGNADKSAQFLFPSYYTYIFVLLFIFIIIYIFKRKK